MTARNEPQPGYIGVHLNLEQLDEILECMSYAAAHDPEADSEYILGVRKRVVKYRNRLQRQADERKGDREGKDCLLSR